MSFERRTMRIRQYDSPLTSTVPIAMPTFGYAVELILSLDIKRLHQNVKSFDDGIKFDKRRCTFRIQATEQQLWLLNNVLERERRNKHNRFVLTLEQGSGFFPAGADKGDSGEFVFSFLDNINFSAMKLNPLGLFDVNFRILIHEYPDFSVLPAPKDLGGKFSFGSVAELRDPQIRPIQDFSSRRGVTLGGEVLTIWTPTDEFRSNLTIRTTTGKMAELARYLQMVRGDEFTVTPGRRYWLWGGQGAEWSGDLGEQVKLLDAHFIMTHTDFDLWTLPVQLWQHIELQPPAPRPTYGLTVNMIGNGTVRVNGVISTGTTQHNTGDFITVKAEAAQDYGFAGWIGASTSQNAEINFVMETDNIELTANFVEAVTGVWITLNSPTSGNITVNVKRNGVAQESISSGSKKYDAEYGDVFEIAAIPRAGFRFLKWNAAINQVLGEHGHIVYEQIEISPVTVIVTAMSWLEAIGEPTGYVIELSVPRGRDLGTITVNGVPVESIERYQLLEFETNAPVTLVATPKTELTEVNPGVWANVTNIFEGWWKMMPAEFLTADNTLVITPEHYQIIEATFEQGRFL